MEALTVEGTGVPWKGSSHALPGWRPPHPLLVPSPALGGRRHVGITLQAQGSAWSCPPRPGLVPREWLLGEWSGGSVSVSVVGVLKLLLPTPIPIPPLHSPPPSFLLRTHVVQG